MIHTIGDLETKSEYLGDGVYIIKEATGFWLLTGNGIKITNEIWLSQREIVVLQLLYQNWLKEEK